MNQPINYPPSNVPAPVANCSSSPTSWHIPQSGRSNGLFDFFLDTFYISLLTLAHEINCFSLHFKGSNSNQPNQNPLSMQFCTNGRLNENSFKISLKSPNSLKQPTPPIQTASSVPPATVTSTNPKTPSPSTNDVRQKQKCS